VLCDGIEPGTEFVGAAEPFAVPLIDRDTGTSSRAPFAFASVTSRGRFGLVVGPRELT
jgi:hypothetical protein